MPFPAQIDDEYLALSRAHITAFLRRYLEPVPEGKILEVGPKLGWPQFETLDINPAVGATYTADLTRDTGLPESSYDIVLLISILEHTLDPVGTVREVRRLLKPGGLLLAETPFNFRIHGPKNDCWRFTEHGVKVLMRDFDDVNISILEAPSRPLFPISYAWTARCNKDKNVSPECIAETFRWIP